MSDETLEAAIERVILARWNATLVYGRSVGLLCRQAGRLAAGYLVLTCILVALCMGLAYLALVVFVADSHVLGFVWHTGRSIDTHVLERYYQDRNLFMAIGAAGGLVITLCVGLSLSGGSYARPPQPAK